VGALVSGDELTFDVLCPVDRNFEPRDFEVRATSKFSPDAYARAVRVPWMEVLTNSLVQASSICGFPEVDQIRRTE
jgi:hypothetical protein